MSDEMGYREGSRAAFQGWGKLGSTADYFSVLVRVKILEHSSICVLIDQGARMTRKPETLIRVSDYILVYSIPEPRPTRDPSLTQASLLCSPSDDRFVDVLSLCSPMLPRCSPLLSRCSPLLPHCSLVLPLCSPVLPLSHFLLVSCYCVLTSLNESVQSACFEC